MSYREVRTCETPSSKTLKNRLRIIISILAEDFRDFWYIIYAKSYGKNLWNDFSGISLFNQTSVGTPCWKFSGLVQGFAWCSSRLNLGFGGSRYLSWKFGWVMDGRWLGGGFTCHLFSSLPIFGDFFFVYVFYFSKGVETTRWNLMGLQCCWLEAMYSYSYSHILNFPLRLRFHVAAASCEFSLRPKFSSESSGILGNFHKLDGFCRIFTKSSRIVFSLELSKTKNKSYILKVPRQAAKLEWGSIWHCFC